MPHPTEKISEQVISHIRNLILSGELKPGDRLGSDKELMNRFNVSKATLREALRVLEVLGLILIRKGKSGGVFVAEVDMRTTLNSLMAFLRFKSVSIRNITSIRYLLEPAIITMIINTLEDNDIENLESIVEKHHEAKDKDVLGIGFHRYLARATQNPLLILIMDFIDNILSDLKIKAGLDDKFYNQIQAYHKDVLSCIRQKDVLGARETMIIDVLYTGDTIAALMHDDRFDPREGNTFSMSALAGQVIDQRSYNLPDLERILPDFLLKQESRLLLRQIGTGEIYLVDLSGHHKNNDTSETSRT